MRTIGSHFSSFASNFTRIHHLMSSIRVLHPSTRKRAVASIAGILARTWLCCRDSHCLYTLCLNPVFRLKGFRSFARDESVYGDKIMSISVPPSAVGCSRRRMLVGSCRQQSYIQKGFVTVHSSCSRIQPVVSQFHSNIRPHRLLIKEAAWQEALQGFHLQHGSPGFTVSWPRLAMVSWIEFLTTNLGRSILCQPAETSDSFKSLGECI